jgi:hypothetical protein
MHEKLKLLHNEIHGNPGKPCYFLSSEITTKIRTRKTQLKNFIDLKLIYGNYQNYSLEFLRYAQNEPISCFFAIKIGSEGKFENLKHPTLF